MNSKLKKLKFYLSEDRLIRYYDVANKNLRQSILLYKKDIKYCQKLYTALNLFEIILRNAINEQLSKDFKEIWYEETECINFNEKQLTIINKAKDDILSEDKEIANSNILTKLTFGFWCNLFNGEHDKTLWRVSLYKIFKNLNKPPKRNKVRDYLQKFRRMRNRISHCECIVQYPVDRYYNNLLEFLDWIDGDVAKWIKKEVNFNK